MTLLQRPSQQQQQRRVSSSQQNHRHRSRTGISVAAMTFTKALCVSVVFAAVTASCWGVTAVDAFSPCSGRVVAFTNPSTTSARVRRRRIPALLSSSSSSLLLLLSEGRSSSSRIDRPYQGFSSSSDASSLVRLGMSVNGDNDNDKDVDGTNVDSDVDASSVPAAAAVGVNHPARSTEPAVFFQRWIQLGWLSVLALLSDWICFSVAAVPDTYETAFPGHSAAALIDIFLFTNVASCFLVTDVVAAVGLQKAVQGSAVLMAAGTWLRSGISFLPLLPGNAHLVTYPFVVAGTVLVGAAQPFFQCTPPALSATWFAPAERATSTAVALNFNQIGIATAFLVGGAMATSRPGLENYFGLIAVLATAAAAGTALQFEDAPPVPPSASELEKMIAAGDGGGTVKRKEPPFLESVQTFFRTPGFTKALAAFVCSISITNIVGAFIDEVLERGGITEQFQIDLAGAGFELAILAGGIVIGGYVDRTKKYKDVTLACLAATAALVVPLGLTEHAIGKEPVLLLLSLLGLGVAAGPVQPINAELAVDVTYPGDETAVESIQQIGGNLVSALLVPVAELAAQRDYQLLPTVSWLASDIRGDVVLLVALAAVTIAYFSTFDAPLARTAADEEGADDSEQGLPLNVEGAAEAASAAVSSSPSTDKVETIDAVVTAFTASSSSSAAEQEEHEVRNDVKAAQKINDRKKQQEQQQELAAAAVVSSSSSSESDLSSSRNDDG